MTSKNSCDTPAIGFQNNVITVTLNPYFFLNSVFTFIPKVKTVIIALKIMARISCHSALLTPDPAFDTGQLGSFTFKVEFTNA